MRRFRSPNRPPRGRRPASARWPRYRRAWGTPSHAILAVAGLLIYFATLWFGVAVIGDNPTRSALMAGLVVLIAAVGYAVRLPSRE
jgi:hypothetical protein